MANTKTKDTALARLALAVALTLAISIEARAADWTFKALQSPDSYQGEFGLRLWGGLFSQPPIISAREVCPTPTFSAARR